jgi:biotin synthase
MMELGTSQSGANGQSADRTLRHDWSREEAQALYEAPFNDLLFKAHAIHRRLFVANTVKRRRVF